MANLLESFNNNKTRERIINNFFLHEYQSPYDVNRNNLVDKAIKKIDKINFSELFSKEEYVKSIQKNEERKMINMYVQLLAIMSEDEITEAAVLKEAKHFNNLSTFDEKVKILNRAYRGFLKGNKITSKLIGEDGRVRWKDIQEAFDGKIVTVRDKKGKDIAIRTLSKQEEQWFNDWYQVFRLEDNNNFKNLSKTKISIGPFSKEKINAIKQKFLEYEQTLENNISNFEKQEEYAKAEMLKIIQEYTLGRGLNLITNLSKKSGFKDDFNTIRENLSGQEMNTNLSQKIKTTSKPKNIHYSYKDIRGSFSTTIGGESQKGFVAEKIKEMAENLSFTIKGKSKSNSFSWTAERVGNITNESNKMQKIDNITIIPELIEIKETKNGQEISYNTHSTSNLQLGFSLKDYRDADVSLHSGGNLDSVIEYLSQNIKMIDGDKLGDAAREYFRILGENDIKYFLINEGEPHRIKYSRNQEKGFFKHLSESISNFGPVFALSKISAENGTKGVDFMLINQVIIPGSYLFLAARNMIKRYHTTISPGNYPTGPEVKDKRVTSPDYTPEKVIAKDNYSEELLQKVSDRNLKIYYQTTFTVHLNRSFKNELIDLINSI